MRFYSSLAKRKDKFNFFTEGKFTTSISLPCNLQSYSDDIFTKFNYETKAYRIFNPFSSLIPQDTPNLLKSDFTVKPVICQICGSKFKKKSNWKIHLFKHRFSENFVNVLGRIGAACV